MNSMFFRASNFNSDISAWDVSSVVDMTKMFADALAFNQPIGKLWDVSSVRTMGAMFQGAKAFDQTLQDWNVASVVDMTRMFENASLDIEKLRGWNISSTVNLYDCEVSKTTVTIQKVPLHVYMQLF